ncbi:Gfo/Idh/MocA family oxidoreductase [Acidisoma cellulosilytica]|uniref:Gfo/Idh/MocA family oxidoreductase n=1 Tax=Acidisoma cellulosilyticum TaxID=2802395 RepID=A0A964E5A0_9PROT|nr:Gfo/Idh/MocA family oxidoreductase [Acidisoma cellulosilyticum]MCB8881763.1 Gfo/Idh/MocA family oxidoreductase [Acidisoma cellulosilyticum]
MVSPGTVSRRLRLGMVGGGPGSLIGPVHRIAARLDDRFELVAGALSSDRDRARQGAAEVHIAPDRSYDTWQAMVAAEAARPDRIDVVAIVTPNHLHHGPAKAFMEAGIDVICDKPLTLNTAEAEDLVRVQQQTGRIFGVTHTYAGYPMVRQARAMVAAGAIGRVRLVNVEYVQSWLTEPLEATGNKQAGWRTDPAFSGAGGCVGDIGTHAYHLASFVSGMLPDAICADLTAFAPGRKLDDNVHILMRYGSGARGMIWATQVAPGNDNGIRVRIYGETGGISWFQEQPNDLHFTRFGEAPQRLGRAGVMLGGIPRPYEPRAAVGHPEGYLEAFAQLYTDMAEQMTARNEGRAAAPDSLQLATIGEGLIGMRFIDAAIASSAQGGTWVSPDSAR